MPKRRIIHTKYVRVLKWKAFQVEIHPIEQSSSSCHMESSSWFQDSHMQEVLLLLRSVMCERAVLKSKDLDTVKTPKSDILTGSIIRLGYSLKRKQEHQMCLLPADFSHTLSSKTDSAASRYRNLVLHSEKLVVYVYPLQGSSQQNMIQLLSAVRESNPTHSQKVSISNYFQKTSPNTKYSQNIKTAADVPSKSSDGTGAATSQKCLVMEEKCASSTDDPSNASRKRTLKSIIGKSQPKFKTKKRKVVKSVIKSSCTEPCTKQTSKKNVHNEQQATCSDDNVFTNPDYQNVKDEIIDLNDAERTRHKCCAVVRKNCRIDGDEHCSNLLSENIESSHKLYFPDRVDIDMWKNTEGKNSPPNDDYPLELQTSEPEKILSCCITSNKSSGLENGSRSLFPEKNTASVVADTVSSFCTNHHADTFPSKFTMSPEITCTPDSLELNLDKGKAGIPLLKSKCLSVKMLRKMTNHNSSTKRDTGEDKMAKSTGVAKRLINLKDQKHLRSFSPVKMVSLSNLDEVSPFCTGDQTTLKLKQSLPPEITDDSLKIKSSQGNVGLPILKSKCLSVKMLRKIAKHSSDSNKGEINRDKIGKSSGCGTIVTHLKNQKHLTSVCPKKIVKLEHRDHLSSSTTTSDQKDDFTSILNVSSEITDPNHEQKVKLPLLKSRCLSVKTLNKIAKQNSLQKSDFSKNKIAESQESGKTSIKTKDQKCVSYSETKVYDDPYEFEISPKKAKKEYSVKQMSVSKKCCIKETILNSDKPDKLDKETILTTDKSDELVKDSHVVGDEDYEKLPEIFCKKRDRWKKRLTEIFPLHEESNSPVIVNIDDVCHIENSTEKENIDCEPYIYISDDEVHVNKELGNGSGIYNLLTQKKNNLAELIKELKQIQSVDNIQNMQLEKLVFSYETYLRKLFQGQISCWRHQEYKKGGSSRANLNYCVHFGLFTEEQQDVVMETLMSIFCKRHHKYLDYIMKVLLPEILIKILMEMKDMSHNEADTLLATSQQSS